MSQPKGKIIDMRLHPLQMRAYKSNKRIICLVSGIQGGKTRVGGLWLIKLVNENPQPENNFIVCAPDYKVMSQSTLPWFMELFSGCGDMDRKDDVFHVKHGPSIYLRSMVDPDSIEGITNVRGIWADEAGKMKMKSWVNIMGRAAFKQAPVMLTTTPYALNWLYRDVYQPWMQKKRDDIEVVQFKSIDNPYFPKEEFERQKTILDPRIFSMKYEGTFQKMAGLVYPDLTEDNYEPPFKVSERDYNVVAGVDIGYQDPFVIVVRAIGIRENKIDYQVAEYYKSFVNPVERVEVMKQYQSIYGIKMFYVDSAHPDDIALMQTAGLNVTPVEKGRGSVEYGIQLHNQLIKTKKYRLFTGRNPHTEDEYSLYSYIDSYETDKSSEVPVDMNNHAMDANRYVTVMTQHVRDHTEQPPTEKSHLEKLLGGEYHKRQLVEDWTNA